MPKKASLRSTSSLLLFLKSIPALLVRDWRIAVVMLVGIVGIAVVVISSNKLVSDIEAEAAALGKVYKNIYPIVMEHENLPQYVSDGLWEVLKINDYVPVVIVDPSGHITDARNLVPGDSIIGADSLVQVRGVKSFNEIRSTCDTIFLKPYFEDAELTVYIACESNIVKSVSTIRTIEILMFLVFGAGLFFVLRWGFRRESEAEFHALSKLYAHQIGSPLQSVQGVADRLELMFMKASASQASTQADAGSLQVKGAALKEMTDELNGDIQRLREVADRLQRQGDGCELTNSPLNKDLAKVADYIRTRTGAGVEVVFRAPDGEVSAPHDNRLFRWAVENICKNAADAIGGNPGLIAITLHDDGDKAVIEIEDTGKGMSKETMARIFDAGFSTKGKAGWGVGLALTKRIIVDGHKGKVFVDRTELGVGTTFKIILNKSKK